MVYKGAIFALLLLVASISHGIPLDDTNDTAKDDSAPVYYPPPALPQDQNEDDVTYWALPSPTGDNDNDTVSMEKLYGPINLEQALTLAYGPDFARFPGFNMFSGEEEDPIEREEVEGVSMEEEDDHRIIGGFYAKPGQFPFIARLGNFCGATLISKMWVLTAAHCIRRRRPSSIWVRVGTIDQFNGGQTRRGYRIVIHRNYNPNLGYVSGNDIALLRVDHPFEFNPWVQPALVHSSSPSHGSRLLAAGWGRTSSSSHAQSRFLKAAILRVSNCGWTPGNKPSLSSLVCMHDQTDRTCNGDSGSFLGNELNGSWRVMGAVSYGPKNCPSNGISVFTSVPYYSSWIWHATRQFETD